VATANASLLRGKALDRAPLPMWKMCDSMYLEWSPWSRDEVNGLSHQLSSLSCALGEAYYLGRTLLLPHAGLCSASGHTARWRSGARRDCVGWDALLDLEALSRVVPVRASPLDVPPNATVHVGANWSSRAVRTAYPCDGAGSPLLVRRRLTGFWFESCVRYRTSANLLKWHLNSALRLQARRLSSGPSLPVHPSPRLIARVCSSRLALCSCARTTCSTCSPRASSTHARSSARPPPSAAASAAPTCGCTCAAATASR